MTEARTNSKPSRNKGMIIRYDLHMALIDGIFYRPKGLPPLRSDRLMIHLDRAKVDVVDEASGSSVKDGAEIIVESPEHLGVAGESVFLAAMSTCQEGNSRPPFAHTDGTRDLATSSDLAAMPIGIGRASRYEVMGRAGMKTSGNDYDNFDSQVFLLNHCRVTFRDAVNHKHWTQNIISISEDHGGIEVLINWLLLRAVLGDNTYATISLDERNCLKKDRAKTLHRWLSAYVRPKNTRNIQLNTLLSHVWPVAPKHRGTVWNRRSKMREELLPAIDALTGWSVDINGEKVTVKRKRLSKN